MRQAIRFVTVLAVLATASCSRHRDPVAFVERYVELHRSADVDGLLAIHTDDSEFLIPGQEPIRGVAALRDLFEWDAVLGSELVMADIRSDGDTIIIDSLAERSQWFAALGFVEARFQPGTRIVLRDGRVAGTYPTAFDDATQQRLLERFSSVLDWLGKHRPDALSQLLPRGKFRYNAANARLWLEVLAEWNNAQEHGG